jgi:hypothetical protein
MKNLQHLNNFSVEGNNNYYAKMLTQISEYHLDEKERTAMADTTQRLRYFFEPG